MEVDFYKLHCLGHDIILINYLRNSQIGVYKYSELARLMSKRHRAVGSGGVLFLINAGEKMPELRYYSHEGEERGDSYDAVICASRYLFDSGLTDTEHFSLKLSETEYFVDVIDSNNFRISLGTPRNPNSGSGLVYSVEGDYSLPVTVDEKQFHFSPVQIDYPYLIHITNKWERGYLYSLSRKVFESSLLSKNIQTVFLFLLTRDNCRVKTWKHSGPMPDFIRVCGAAGVAGVMNGLMDKEAVLELNGGTVYFQWAVEANEIFITTAAHYVFSGTYEVPDTLLSSSM